MTTTIFSTRDPSISLTFDNLESFQVVSRATVTAHPIEQGAAVIDHRQLQSGQVFLTGRVTATPFTSVASVTDPLQAARLSLDILHQEGLVTVVNPDRGTFVGYSLDNISYPQSALGEMLVTLSLSEVKTAVALDILIAPREPTPALQVGAPDPQDAGSQPLETPPTAVDSSLLSTISSLVLGG